jgi:hypothetical protein
MMEAHSLSESGIPMNGHRVKQGSVIAGFFLGKWAGRRSGRLVLKDRSQYHRPTADNGLICRAAHISQLGRRLAQWTKSEGSDKFIHAAAAYERANAVR